jgi:hypothetical protein
MDRQNTIDKAMGSRTFDFLTESFLFQERLIDEDFSRLTEEELRAEISRYTEFCLEREQELLAEIDRNTGNLVMFSDEGFNPNLLKQAALYVSQYIVEDPLVALSKTVDENAAIMGKYLGIGSGDELDRQRLAAVIRQMKSATPMVAANFLKFLPRRKEQPPAEFPIKYSAIGFEDILPSEILALFKSAATVTNLRQAGGGAFAPQSRSRPARVIDIRFKGHSDRGGFIYFLSDHKAVNLNEQQRSYTAQLSMPDEPPERGLYHAWVKQSVNQAAGQLFRSTMHRVTDAARVNAVFSTRSDLLYKALQKAFKPESSVPVHTANVFLNLELPFLEQIRIADLMKLRQEEGEAFQRFRLLLDQKLTSVRATDDLEEAKRQARAAVHELTEVKTDEVEVKLKGLREKLAVNSAIALCSLAAAVQTNGWGLISLASAAASVGKTYFDYKQDAKRHPAFFLWKLLRRARK